MIKIATKDELSQIDNYPEEVKEKVFGLIDTLDALYGVIRAEADDGGYVLVIEGPKDFEDLREEFDIEDDGYFSPEYVEQIVCENGEVFTTALILLNNEFAISLVIRLENTPGKFIDYLIN